MMDRLTLLYNQISASKGFKIGKVVLFYLLSFVIPLILVTSLFKVNGYYPFVKDGQSLLMIDMQGQYIAFFRYYKGILDGKYDVLYTLGKVSGGDMLSILIYYLASPFNLILKFFSFDTLPAGIMWIVCLKIASTGLTTYTALRLINKNGKINLILAITYSLIAYNFVYYSNVMWLDGVLALPLIAAGIIKIIRKETYLIYIFALAYAIMTNWYIGIMLCIFSVLFFLANLLFESKHASDVNKVVIVFGVSSLVAGMISFAFWGSAYFNILGTRGGQSFTKINVTIKQFYDTLSITRGFFFGSYQGMKNINGTAVAFYVGSLPLILTLFFFLNPNFELKQKLPILVLISIYLLAFYNKGIDHIFHGGPAPNWFPGRYTFIFGFILIYYASVSVNHIKTLKLYHFVYPILLFIGSLLLMEKLDFEVTSKSYIFYLGAFILVLILYLLSQVDSLKKVKDFKYLAQFKLVSTQVVILSLALVSILNVYQNANHVLMMFNETLYHPSMEKYGEDEKIGFAIDYIKAYDSGLYRIEKGFVRSQTYNNANNDAMYYGYNGLSHFSSNEKKATMEYMRKIGFHYNGFNANYQNGSTLAMNAFLGVKYLLDNESNRAFNMVKRMPLLEGGIFDNIKIYENTYALPFLFPVEYSSVSYIGEGIRQEDNSVYWFDIFEYQNNIFKSAINTVIDEEGKPKDIFKKASYTKSLNQVEETSKAYHYNIAHSGTISYNITLDRPTNYYYYFHTSDTSNLQLISNGNYTTYFSYHGYQIDGIKYTGPTSTIKVNINAPKTNIEIKEALYYEDLEVLGEYIQAIKNKAEVELQQYSSSHYVGSVETKQDNQTMLMTIPYDENIKIYVDGKKVETLTRFNIFTAFILDKRGQHKVEIKYTQPSFTVGLPLGILIALLTGLSPIIIPKTMNYIKKKKEKKA